MTRGSWRRTALSVLCLCTLLLLAAVSQTAAPAQQSQAQQRSFQAPKAAVQKALHELPSFPGGKLPVLDGFADPAGHPLDHYKRGYYQYEVQMKPSSTGATTVLVTTKITAWYEGTASANSGYRLLKSTGRLESDLLDALDDKLNPNASSARQTGSSATVSKPLPDTPSAGTSFTLFNAPRLTSAPSGTLAANSTVARPVDPATAKRLKALGEEADNLQEILKAQVRPNNLAVVKRSNTPVVAQPVNGAEVMFQADAEDEFEVLDSGDGWVHIKISDLSRAWIRRDYVDMPGAATVNIVAAADQHERETVRQTKEEVAAFPGQWQPLDGKQVKIIWVQPLEKEQFGSGPKWSILKPVFRKADAGSPSDPTQIAGVVVIFDAQDGGMAATTSANLQQWRAGHLSDESFWKRCWRDPADAFGGPN